MRAPLTGSWATMPTTTTRMTSRGTSQSCLPAGRKEAGGGRGRGAFSSHFVEEEMQEEVLHEGRRRLSKRHFTVIILFIYLFDDRCSHFGSPNSKQGTVRSFGKGVVPMKRVSNFLAPLVLLVWTARARPAPPLRLRGSLLAGDARLSRSLTSCPASCYGSYTCDYLDAKYGEDPNACDVNGLYLASECDCSGCVCAELAPSAAPTPITMRNDSCTVDLDRLGLMFFDEECVNYCEIVQTIN